MMTIKVRKDIRTIITEVNTRNPTTTNINHIIKITIISKPIHNINTKINITIRISILISINNTRNLTINNNHSNRLQLMLSKTRIIMSSKTMIMKNPQN